MFTSDRDLSSILSEIPNSRLREKEFVSERSVVRVMMTALTLPVLSRSVIIVAMTVAVLPELRLCCCDRQTRQTGQCFAGILVLSIYCGGGGWREMSRWSGNARQNITDLRSQQII